MPARDADSAGSVLREGTALGKLGSWPTRAGLADRKRIVRVLHNEPRFPDSWFRSSLFHVFHYTNGIFKLVNEALVIWPDPEAIMGVVGHVVTEPAMKMRAFVPKWLESQYMPAGGEHCVLLDALQQSVAMIYVLVELITERR